jgi:hypothetical protein
MAILTTLSEAAIASRKAETLNSQAIRKTIAIREIDLINDTTIEIQGKRLEITKDAFKNLMQIIGMSQTFAKKFETLFSPEAKASFINQMKNAMSSQLNEITLIVSPTTKRILGFSKAATGLISHERFINIADQIIDQHGFEITNWGVDANKGLVTINAFNPKAEFGVSDEVFKAGLTMTNSPHKGIQVMPYVNRMWCTNGLTTPMASESYTLANLSQESMENFFQHMAHLRKNGFVPEHFADTVKKAMNTPASLWEMQRAHNTIKRHVGDAADNWIPLNENKSVYTKANINLDSLSSDEIKNAHTNQSIWSLVNGITHVATHAPEQLAFNMTDKDSTELMVQAGNVLGKSWDLGNQVPNPFKTNQLDPRAQVGALLN